MGLMLLHDRSGRMIEVNTSNVRYISDSPDSHAPCQTRVFMGEVAPSMFYVDVAESRDDVRAAFIDASVVYTSDS